MKRAAGEWVVSGGGVGLLPAMPGTYASLVALVVFYAAWATARPWARISVAGLAVAAAVAGLLWCPWAQRHFGRRDPRQFVLDELVGQWVVLLLAPLGWHPLSSMVAAFFLFRAMDVAKPFPIRQVERLPAGWGVVLDDIAAALYAVVALRLLVLVIAILLGHDPSVTLT